MLEIIYTCQNKYKQPIKQTSENRTKKQKKQNREKNRTLSTVSQMHIIWSRLERVYKTITTITIDVFV